MAPEEIFNNTFSSLQSELLRQFAPIISLSKIVLVIMIIYFVIQIIIKFFQEFRANKIYKNIVQIKDTLLSIEKKLSKRK
nr:hypothetical protein [uncultured archaeon]AQS33465.1 hypothetical protein [uncultured archaeon]